MEDLDELSEVISQLQSGVGAEPAPTARPSQVGGTAALASAAKKKLEPAVATPAVSEAESHRITPASAATMALTAENAVQVWDLALSQLSGMVVDQARHFSSIAIPAPNRLVIRFKPGYALFKTACERPEQVATFEQALAAVTGGRIRVEFALTEDEA